ATAGERDPVEGAQIDGRREAHADQRVPPAVRLAERKAASRRPRATPGALGLEREGLTGALRRRDLLSVHPVTGGVVGVPGPRDALELERRIAVVEVVQEQHLRHVAPTAPTAP